MLRPPPLNNRPLPNHPAVQRLPQQQNWQRAFGDAFRAIPQQAVNALGVNFQEFRFDPGAHFTWIRVMPMMREWFRINRMHLLQQLEFNVAAGRQRLLLFRMQWMDAQGRTAGIPFVQVHLRDLDAMEADLERIFQMVLHNENNDPHSSPDLERLERIDFQYTIVEHAQVLPAVPNQVLPRAAPVPPRPARNNNRELAGLGVRAAPGRARLRSMDRRLRSARAGATGMYRAHQIDPKLKALFYKRIRSIRQVKGDGLCFFRCMALNHYVRNMAGGGTASRSWFGLNSKRQEQDATFEKLIMSSMNRRSYDNASLEELVEGCMSRLEGVVVYEWRSITQKRHCATLARIDQQQHTPMFLMWDPLHQHVDYLIEPRKFFRTKYQCPSCFECYSTEPHAHRCVGSEMACSMCLDNHEEDFLMLARTDVFCAACQRTCVNQACFDAHVRNQMCRTSYYCPSCDKVFARSLTPMHEHRCDRLVCARCKIRYARNQQHFCAMPPLKTQHHGVERKYAVYDFETTPDVNGRMHVNLAMFYLIDTQQFFEYDSIDLFCQHLFEHCNHYTFIAHCGSRFDVQFIVDWAVQHGKAPQVIANGRQLFAVEFGALRFIDSAKFMACSLDAMAKALGVTGVAKGVFPHRFNQPEHYSYVGPWPALEWYDVHLMKPAQAAKVTQFVQESQHKTFDFQAEFRAYCRSDVMVLAECVRKFQAVFAPLQVDPYEFCTIAGAAMYTYRTNFMPPLNPLRPSICTLKAFDNARIRQALYGGRTEVFYRHVFCVSPTQRIVPVDVCSMYPHVMLECEYPEGEPVWIHQPNWYDDHKFGVVLCDIDPPPLSAASWMPVLPHRRDSKLYFDLEPQRDVWHTSVELREAVQQGYVVRAKGMYWWPRTTRDLFRTYVLHWYKQKVQYSGFPSTCHDRAAYLAELRVRYGIVLEEHEVHKDDAMRSVAKIMLNSLWGKFGQDPVRVSTEFLNTSSAVMDVLNDTDHLILSMRPIGTDVIEVRSKPTEHCLSKNPPTTTCVSLAVFTTAHARLKLWREAQRLGAQRVVYCDTDSLYVMQDVADDRQVPFMYGEHLGDWTRELPSHQWICEFVALGPKFYAYKVWDQKEQRIVDEKFRAKGVAMHQADRQILTFDMYKTLLDSSLSVQSAPQLSMRITAAHHVEILSDFTKILRSSPAQKRSFYPCPLTGHIASLPLPHVFQS